jgi:hypothetical protein
MNIDLSAWSVNEKDFPRDGSEEDKLHFCLRYAVLAPSTYNTQPWHFRIVKNKVYIYGDRRHALPVVDPDDRELTISCATALFSLRLAIRYFGYDSTTDILPSSDGEYCVATVKLGAKIDEAEQSEKDQFKALLKRHTNRGVFADKVIPEDSLKRIQKAATSEGAWLHVCDDIEQRNVLRMIAEADHIQTGDKHFRRELAAWTDQRRALSNDGLPNLGLSYDEVINSLAPCITRRFAVKGKQTASNEELNNGTPILAILGTNKGGSVERVKAGQAYMKTWLQAEVEGLSISSLNQVCEVPSLRLRLHDELTSGTRAQVVMRIGYGGKPSFSPRRPIEEVVEVEGGISARNDSSRNSSKKRSNGLVGRFFKG